MHIIILTRILPFHDIGGMQVLTWDLATEWVKKGIQVTCITTRIPDYPDVFIQDGINVIALKNTKPAKYSRNWWVESKDYIQQNHINDCTVLFSVSAAGFRILDIKDKMKNTIFVFQGHGTSLSEIMSKFRLFTFKSLLSSVKNIKWFFIDLFYYSKFDAIVAAGERVYRDFDNKIYRFFLKDLKLKYIPNGIDINLFKASSKLRKNTRSDLNIAHDEFVVLIASRLHSSKGIIGAINAFSKFEKTNKAKLILLGNGPEESNIKKTIKLLNLSSKTLMLGSVSLNELPKYFNAADVYLFTTLHEEGLPLMPLEALACSLPVVTSAHLKEIVTCSNFVIPVNPKNTDSILHGINLSKKYVLKNEINLPECYQLDYIAQEYLNYFKELQNEKK